MPTRLTIVDPHWLRRLAAALGLCALIAGAISLSGWVFDIPRFTNWVDGGLSIQPNTSVLVALAGAAVMLLQYGYRRSTITLGGFVALGGALSLLQYIIGVDFGFNHQLLFGRQWGHEGTMAPGRFGLPASLAFIIIGISLVLLGACHLSLWRIIPMLALFVVLLTMLSLLGYLFDARNFYAIPWLSAIALPSSFMLMVLAVSLIVSVPQYQPMLLLSERSSAGSMARTVLPIMIFMIPLFLWLRVKGYEMELFDLGTSRALGSAVLMIGSVSLMWIALLALRRREQREREADVHKDEFLAMLAHELRNPLAPIGNAASMLKLAQGNVEMSGHAINMIERQLTHLVRLVDDLLDVSRINTGKLELRRKRIELAPVIHQAVETCNPMVESAGQQIIVHFPAQSVYLDADPVRLAQIISNLLNNACKFAGRGGQINLAVSRYDNDVTITVKDNGIGIPREMLSVIFEMFSQIDQSLERSQSGLGIGLGLAKRLVELHDGSIEAHSDGLGKGSEFVIRLPVIADQAPMPESKCINELNIGKRILIVDDNQDSAKSLAEVLRLTGHETFVVHDGEAAVRAAESQRPDAIVLDIGLPKLNGFEACRRIREHQWAEKMLVIALTGWGQDDDRRKSAEAGFDCHLVKPVNLAELTNLLARLPPETDLNKNLYKCVPE